jgi:GTP-binding protein
MAQHEVELLQLCADVEDCPRAPRPDIALSGRSNVGKSSLINMLLGRRRLARTSKDPGRTRCLIYYLVDRRWHLVDMPGYGYARVAAEERRRWFAQARQYFQRREQLCAVVQLIDLKVGPTSDDRARLRELLGIGSPLCLVFTKADKVSRVRHEAKIRDHLQGLDLELPRATGIVLSSVPDGYGRRELWAWIEDRLLAFEQAGSGGVPSAGDEAETGSSGDGGQESAGP